jgi:hypothetical protein
MSEAGYRCALETKKNPARACSLSPDFMARVGCGWLKAGVRVPLVAWPVPGGGKVFCCDAGTCIVIEI